MRKRLLSLSVVLAVFLGALPASAALIHEEKTVTAVTKGVTQTEIRRFTDKGWYRIFTLRIDLNEEFLALKTLTAAEGVGTRKNTLDIARDNGALGAVNADFFQPSGSNPNGASALGVVIDEGKMRTSPARGKAMATAALSREGIMTMGLWDQYITITAPDGEGRQIIHVNKYFDEGGLVLFNSDWDASSPGVPLTNMEMVVTDGVVTELRAGQEGYVFEENSYVIASTARGDTFLTDHFQVGDPVDVATWVEPSPEAYSMAVGGGTLLLSGGRNAPVTHNISGVHPRSAMGADETGRIIYLVTVDGRQSVSVGMSMDELRDYMRDLGCHDAINLDGGGSTTFVTKLPAEEALSVKNKPSDGGLRKVANAVGVVSGAPVGAAAVLEIQNGRDEFESRKAVELRLRLYDEYYHPLTMNAGEVSFSVSGVEGTFTGTAFYPMEEGNGVITATYRGVTGHLQFYARPKAQTAETDGLRLAPDAALSGTKIAVLGSTNYRNMLGRLYSYKAIEKVGESADAVMLVDSKEDVAGRIAAPVVFGGDYYAAYKQETLMVQLDNRKGGLYKSDSAQWARLKALLASTYAQNVVLTLSRAPGESFTDAAELALLKKVLTEELVDRGKTVFVVYPDASNTFSMENGIRYFGLTGFRDVSVLGGLSSLREAAYLEITSTDGQVFYQMKNLLQK